MIIKCQRQIPKIQQRIKTSNPRISTVCNFAVSWSIPLRMSTAFVFFRRVHQRREPLFKGLPFGKSFSRQLRNIILWQSNLAMGNRQNMHYESLIFTKNLSHFRLPECPVWQSSFYSQPMAPAMKHQRDGP
jgi:hypothetical protein